MEHYSMQQRGLSESKDEGRVFCFQASLFDEEDGGFLRKINLDIESFNRDDAEFILDEVIGDIADEDFEGVLVNWDTTLTDVH